ncbi:Rho GTPase-activating protein 24 [Hondaea fermentalgiana]|uniref:Rho GTPase-activating protein 24 n=1 Tax=Hondaea fermentalgiana TaxID=2315210 RepID=A0A2R5GDN2_9STRA|nr:Rho GTPase-activating protein 24 [Hondaea fermentalgiana]|eukprot:GBG27828.1 Rho GTPase-activating protein 24 [Hondaea fermentalgiana]
MEDLQRQIASQRSLPTTACADFDGNTEGICALVRFLREHPDLSSTPGIFVESCPTGDPEWVLRKVRSAVSLAMVHDFLEDVNVLSLAQTIKLYLKQREEPLIPEGLNEAVLKAMSPYISRDECVAQLGSALESLDVASWDILREICFMLGEVQNSTVAKIAYSFGPLLLRVELRPSAISSAKDANAAVEALIDERELVFDAVNAPRSTASSKSLSGISTMSSGSETSSPESPPARRPHPRFGVDLAAHINKLRKPRGSAAKSRAR